MNVHELALNQIPPDTKYFQSTGSEFVPFYCARINSISMIAKRIHQSHFKLSNNQRLLLSCFKSRYAPSGKTSILPLPSRASTPSSPVSRS